MIVPLLPLDFGVCAEDATSRTSILIFQIEIEGVDNRDRLEIEIFCGDRPSRTFGKETRFWGNKMRAE
jgi:hypothetical protein